MEIKYSKFKVPDKKSRINSIGQISNLPENSLKKILKTAEDFHNPIPNPEESDWLSSQSESGQTFAKYVSEGQKVSKNHRVIYINPLQNISKNFLNNCLLYCQNFFDPMIVKKINLGSLESLHIESRINEYTNKVQYNASEINSKIANYVPNDAHCVVSILLDDLYPKKEWNFVFGLASYYKRVGVFSFARFNPSFLGQPEPNNLDNYLLYRSCNIL